MVSMDGNVYSFFSSPSNALSSVLLLGNPSLGKYIFKERYDQKWKWGVSVLALGIAILYIREEKKMTLGESCLISLALFFIGHAIAHYAFSPPTSQRRSKGEVLHKAIVLIKSDSNKGAGALVKDGKLGNFLLTVKHVVNPGATVHIKGVEVSLDSLKCYESGSDILLFSLGDIFDLDGSIPMTLANAQLQLGENVYFGGYPFQETSAVLHMGHISAIGMNGKISIDGTAVPGMSGGPIAVERGGKLYVVGTIASETFDPIQGFSKALDRMYCDQSDMEARQGFTQSLQLQSKKFMQSSPQFTKIPKGRFYIQWLEHLIKSDPDCFENMWDDLNRNGVILDDGGIDVAKIIPGHLGLRPEYQQYENDIIKRLKASTTGLTEMNPAKIELPFKTKKPLDSMNTVGLSMVQSLSTGLITAHLLQEYPAAVSSQHGQESTEFEIGRKNRFEKNKKKLKSEAHELRLESKQNETFINTGAPKILYRYVSNDAAKGIKKDGISHSGGELAEIPFLTQPLKKMALSVGAVSTERLVTVLTDKIPELAEENVRKVSERNGVVTYRLNISIPKEAITISEA